MSHKDTVSRKDWLLARKALLVREKSLDKARDALSAARRALPVVRVEKDYWFSTNEGGKSLSDLFGTKSQLITQHFMFGADWDEGCVSCSFWADGFDGITPHLGARDTAFVATSNAPLATLNAYRDRLGWGFEWVSTDDGDFSRDFGVTSDAGDTSGYNYSDREFQGELPGISVFTRLDDGGVGHSYSTYARGLDMLNGAYHYLDLTPKGRDEDGLDWSMAWLRRRDMY